MLKSRTGEDQSVHSVTCAICGRRLVFVIVNRVDAARVLVSTSKYGNSNVAAGVVPMSHESLLFVVVGPPAANVAFGAIVRRLPAAKTDPEIKRVAIKARPRIFLILFSYTIVSSFRYGLPEYGHPLSTIRSPPAPK